MRADSPAGAAQPSLHHAASTRCSSGLDLGKSRPATQPAASELSCSQHPNGTVGVDHDEPQSHPAAVMQAVPVTGKRSRSGMEGDGRQLSRTDLSRAATVIAASLPTAKRRPELECSMGTSSEERAASHAQASGSGAQQEDESRQHQAKRSAAVAVHGNYHRYYGYRLGQAMDRDPRIEVY